MITLRLRWLGFVCCGLGCSSSSLDVIHPPGAGGAPSGGVAAVAGDAGRAAAGSTSVSPSAEPPRFDTPVRIEPLATAGADDDPSLTADLRELYFSSNRDGGEDIWVSVRAAAEDPWGEPTKLTELASEFIDATPGVAPDGLTIWFESTRAAASNELLDTDIWQSSRADRSAPWSEPTLASDLSTSSRDSAPMPASMLLISFSSWRPDGLGDTDIYAAVRASAEDPWSSATLLREVSSTDWDQGMLRADGTQIFVSSGLGVLGGGDLYFSSRSALSGSFAPRRLIEDLSTEHGEQDLWISEDLSYVVFASSRHGDLDLYEARRLRD